MDLDVGVPEEVLAAETRTAVVASARIVTPFIREITFDVGGDKFDYNAGSFVHVVIPPHELSYSEMVTREPIHEIWEAEKTAQKSASEIELRRAYSLATAAEDNPQQIVLNVRFMPPLAGREDDPPGVGSSYMWNLRIGDELKIVGPLGDFRARDSGCDMIVIGGGAGMAPLRSIIRYELAYRKSGRNIQYWYGARSKRDLLYVEELDELQAKYSNFRWHAVLSESDVTDDWNGATGFVHSAVRDALSTSIASHNDVEYYVCGPPPMLLATRKILAEFGVPESRILFDDFGI